MRDWLARQLASPGGVRGGRALVLSGPAGAGKSTAARLLAASAGLQVSEWTPPMPTLWGERHQVSLNSGYTSKMDAFEAWLERSRTLAPLALALAPKTAAPLAPHAAMAPPPPPPRALDGAEPKLLLLEDIPLSCGGADGAKKRLLAALCSLAYASRFPAILILTDSTASELGDEGSCGVREVLSALEGCGAAHIAINPATRAELSKLIARVADAEGARLPPGAAAALAEAAHGDARAALSTLQMRCCGEARARPGASPAAKRRKKAGEKAAAAAAGDDEAAATCAWARSDALSLFHALGKLLYNKREAVAVEPSRSPSRTGGSFTLQPQHVRTPSQVPDPEAVLSQASLAPAAALAFLHENLLDFVHDSAVEDAAPVLALLSDAAALLRAAAGGRRAGAEARGEDGDDWAVGARIAGSLASRGVLFALQHPAPRRFHQLRGPAAPQAERAAGLNRNMVARVVAVAAAGDASCGGSSVIAASDILPYLRIMAPHRPDLARMLPARWHTADGGVVHEAVRVGSGVVDRGAGVSLGRMRIDDAAPALEEEDPIEDAD